MTKSVAEVSIKDVMRSATTVEVGMSFRDVIRKMIIDKTNSLIVVDDDGRCVGMVNPKSLIKAVVPDFLEDDAVAAHFASESIFREEVQKVQDAKIEDLMAKDVAVVKPDDSLMQAAVIALRSGQVRIPVVDETMKPIGLLTRTEIKNLIAAFLDIEEAFSK